MADFKIDADWLKGCVARHLGRTEHRVKRFRRRAKTMEFFKALAASTITGFLALAEIESVERVQLDEVLSAFAIVISAALAVVTAWDALIKPKRQWVLYVSNRNRFSILSEDIQHAERTDTLEPEQLGAFYKRYQKILADSEKKWTAFREVED